MNKIYIYPDRWNWTCIECNHVNSIDKTIPKEMKCTKCNEVFEPIKYKMIKE